MMKYQRNYSVEKTLTKDRRYKKLSGVCAGIAKYYDLPRPGIRIATIIALLAFPVPVGVAYVVATMLMPNSY
jgi:phage shock protein PspC (stress-responsive transcriptional regulator)